MLLSAVGGPKWSDPKAPVRPEQGLLAIRQALGLYANLRPVSTHPAVLDRAPIKAELLQGVDMLVVRELTGGIYFGKRTRTADQATDECAYSRSEIERVVRRAFRLAQARRGYLVSVDKANVLDTSRLWREVTTRIARRLPMSASNTNWSIDGDAPDRPPREYDVIVTENMFGDILTDEASLLAGSLGLLPSASLGEGRIGLYEPIHGSAPDIAGRGIANPYATILSAALLLRHSLSLEAEAVAMEKAVSDALYAGCFTGDIALKGQSALNTEQAAEAVLARLV